MEIKDCVIIGAGPCGIGCAIELKKLGIDAVVLEKGPIGGKVNIAPRVDNYPGFKQIPGPDLAFEFYKKAKDAGVKITADEVISLTKEDDFVIECKRETYYAKTVLVACGTKERTLGLENEERLFGHGISYCAICDGHFFKDKDVLVIGGGNSALKEALYLTNLCNKVTLIHRRNEFRGLNHLVDELKNHENAIVLTPYVPVEFNGADSLENVKIKNVETNEITELKVDGCFPLVGQLPQSNFVKIDGVLNEWGTIPVDKTMMSSVSGLYAGGDILPRDIRQIYLAEHDGMVAAKSIYSFLKGE